MSAHVVALAGGVGGARLCDGLAQIDPDKLTVIVNTGDDFEHLGLHVSPDIDTVLYTLAGISNSTQGWGLQDESWTFMDQLKRLDAPTWFQLGDRDIATHVLRTMRLRAGERLTNIAGDLARRLGVTSVILPMSDDLIPTMVETADETLPFQDYFVRLRCEVAVTGFQFQDIESAQPSPEVLQALKQSDLAAIVICPSNPFISIAPILAVPGIKAAIAASAAPVVAVSPIIGGQAVKGPAAKMMRELGHTPSALEVARGHAGLVDGFVIDHADQDLAGPIKDLGMAVLVTKALMGGSVGRRRLAEDCLSFARRIATGTG